MKHMLIVAGIFVLVGAALVPAYAQTTLQAKVPFNFTVSGKTLVAGEYSVTTHPHQLKIQDENGNVVAMVLANEVSRDSDNQKGRMIFHCYRDRCFLAEVWPVSDGQGRAVLMSAAEAKLVREEQGKYFAVMGERPKR